MEVVRETVSSEDDAIVAEDGVRRGVDVIICATGYKQPAEVFLYPVHITLQQDSGEEVDLTENARRNGFYLGIASSKSPNLFVGMGSGLARNCLLFLLGGWNEVWYCNNFIFCSQSSTLVPYLLLIGLEP